MQPGKPECGNDDAAGSLATRVTEQVLNILRLTLRTWALTVCEATSTLMHTYDTADTHRTLGPPGMGYFCVQAVETVVVLATWILRPVINVPVA